MPEININSPCSFSPGVSQRWLTVTSWKHLSKRNYSAKLTRIMILIFLNFMIRQVPLALAFKNMLQKNMFVSFCQLLFRRYYVDIGPLRRYHVDMCLLSRYCVDMCLLSRYCVDICPLSRYCVDRFCWFLAVSLINTLTRMV